MLAIIGASGLSETALKMETASKKDDIDFCAHSENVWLFKEFKEKLLSLHAQLSAIFPETQEIAAAVGEVLAATSISTEEQPATGKVLLVDDTKMMLLVTGELLSSYGLQVDTASSGAEAIEKIKHNEYKLVFMDHMMRGMDGVETTREIRKLSPKYEKLPIIALTANVDSVTEDFFLANGFNGFISKPVELEKLEEILKTYPWFCKTSGPAHT